MESAVFDVWVARSQTHNKEDERVALDRIRPILQKIIAAAGFLWGPELEPFLITTCLNYSSSWQVPFTTFFIRKFGRKYGTTPEQEEKMLKKAKRVQKQGIPPVYIKNSPYFVKTELKNG